MEDYLQKHNIDSILKELVVQLVTHKPENPIEFMIKILNDKSRGKEVLVEKTSKIEASDYPPVIRPKVDLRRSLQVNRPLAISDVSSIAPLTTPISPSSSPAPTDEANTGQSSSSEEVQAQQSPVRPVLRGNIRTSRRGAICAEPIDVSQTLRVVPKTTEQQDRLDEALKRHIMFAHLETEEKKSIFDAMCEVSFKQGETLIKQGDEGDNFYVVENGECDIYVTDENGHTKHVAVVGRYGSFGELALIYGSPRAATVVAKTDVTCWAIDRNSYRKILMKSTMEKRSMYETFLERVPILAQLTKWERLVIADSLVSQNFDENHVVVREGEPGDRFYIIVDGEASVYQTKENGPVEIAKLKKSDYFGEVALLTDRPRAATVVAATPLRVVSVDRDRFNRVLGPCENILRRNMENYNRFMADKI